MQTRQKWFSSITLQGILRKPKFYLLPSNWVVVTYHCLPLPGLRCHSWSNSLFNNTYSVHARLVVSNSVESVLFARISPMMLSKLSSALLICLILVTVIHFSLGAKKSNLYLWVPKNPICKLKKVLKNAAHLICRSARSQHIYLILCALHWLPIKSCIQYTFLLTFKSLNNQAPSYLFDFIQLYIPSCKLRLPANIQLFRLPSTHLKSSGRRTITLEQSTRLCPTLFFHSII